MKKSKQSSNEILAGGNIRRLFTAPMVICLVLFASVIFYSVFLGFYDYGEIGMYGLIGTLSSEAAEVAKNVNYSPYYYLSSGTDFPSTLTVFGVFFAALQFNFMLNKKHCYTQLSFAVGRRQLFTDKIFFPLVFALSIILFVKLLAVVANIMYLGFTPNLLLGFLVNLVVCFRYVFVGYTVTVVAHMLAARLAEVALLVLTIFNIPSAITNMTNSIFANTLYGYSSFYNDYIDTNIVYSSDKYYTSNYPFDSFSVAEAENFSLIFSDIGKIILCIIAILICKYYFVNKFKAENCGVRGKSTVALIISCIVLPIAFIHTTLGLDYYYSMNDYTPAILYAAGLIFTMIAAVLICLAVTWSTKKIKVGVIAGGIGIGIQLIVMLIGVTGCFGFDVALPEAEEIKSIQITAPFNEINPEADYNDFFENDPENYYYGDNSDIVIVKPEEIALALDIHKTAINNREKETSAGCYISYTMKDGSNVTRYYKNLSKATIEKALGLWKTQSINDDMAVLLNQTSIKELIKTRLNEGYPYEEEDLYYEEDLHYEDPYANSGSSSYTQSVDYSNYSDYYVSSKYGYLFPTPIVDFTGIYFISKDYNVTNYTSIEPDARSEKYKNFTRELQTAIYKDYCALSPEEWFRPEKQTGIIAFEDNGALNGDDGTTSRYGYTFYLNSNMKNTLKVLEKHNLMKCFENTRKIEKAHIVGIKEVSDWINQKEIPHNIYFSQNSYEITEYLSDGCGYKSFSDDYYEDDWYDSEISLYNEDIITTILSSKNKIATPTQTEITDKEKIREMVNESFMAYAVGDEGNFLVVKYSDSCCTMLVLPD